MRPQEGKLLLRALNYDRIPTKKTVFETLLLHLNVPLIGLKPTKVGYLAITEFQHEIDKILNSQAKEKLSAIGLEAKLPIKLKTERSLICRRVDSSIGEMSKEELKEDMNSRNTQLEVVEVTKFGSYTHLFKIELRTIEQAQRVLQNGLLCGHTKIASHQIEKEEFTDILICFNCYKLEDHTSANCPKKGTIVCSECAGHHHFKECNSNIKKCLNCGGPHRTMAMSCPKKKEIIKQKRNQTKEKEQEKQEQTYARVAEKTIEKIGLQTKRTDYAQTALDRIGLTSVIMIMDAHIHNIIEPGSYSKRLNQTLAKNGISSIQLETPDSEKLLSHQVIGETIEAMTERQEKLARLEKIGKELGNDTETSDEEIELELQSNVEIPAASKAAKEYKTKIFALATEVGKRDLTPSRLKQNYLKGTVKFQISDPNITVEQINSLIFEQKIHSTVDQTAFLPATEFRKIRSGHNIRTPPPEKHAKKTKK